MSADDQEGRLLESSPVVRKTPIQRYLGPGLIALGVVAPFVSVSNPKAQAALWILGIPMGMAGLALYAKSKGRSLWWGTMGILMSVGPLLGLLFLAAKKPEVGPKPMSMAQLKWGWLFYIVALWLLPLQAGGLSCIKLPDEQFPPLGMVEGSACGFIFFFVLPVAFFLGIAFLNECNKAIKTFGLRSSASWLGIRAAIIGAALAYAFTVFGTAGKAAQTVEARSIKGLSALQPGMTKNDTERVILQTNALLIPPSGGIQFSDTNGGEAEYQKVQDAMARVAQGQPVNFKDLHFHRALFNANLDSLDRIAAPQPSDSQVLFVRSCCQMMFRWTRYDLFVAYDQENRLTSARYSKSDHEDGQDRSCLVLLEVPAPSNQYPYPCPQKSDKL